MAEKRTLLPLTSTEKERLFQAAGPDALLLRLIGECALSAEDAAVLRWEDVDLEGRNLSGSGRSVPISDETARLLAEASCQGPYVMPAARSPQTPMSRVVVSRKVRQALDTAGFPDLDASLLRTLRILELLETCPIEEVARITGYEVRSLRVLWSRYRTEPLPARSRPRKHIAALDEAALMAALEREGDVLAARAIRLSWQGGLTVKAMLALTWNDVSPTAKKWTIQSKSTLVPESLRPYLRRWRKTDGGEGPLLQGVSSHTAPEPAFLVRRVSSFFLQEGLDSLTLASIRGRAGEEDRLAAVLEQSRPVTAQGLTRELRVSRRRAEAMMAALEQSGSLPPDRRTRFAGVLKAHKGESVTTALLRQETGFATGLLQYYIKEALGTGLLQKEKHGVYRCP